MPMPDYDNTCNPFIFLRYYKLARPTASRANIALRPVPLEQSQAVLLFCPVMGHELTQAIAVLKLDFVFHVVTFIEMPTLS